MAEATVRVHRIDGTLTLEINRPEARNALNGTVVSELLAGLDEAEADISVGTVVITGSGDVFSAGGDLKEAQALHSEPFGLYEADGLYAKLLLRLRALSKPTIAAVNGKALGGGLGLVAGCDLAIASDRAEFGTPEIRVGLFPMMIMAPLATILGPRQALELFLSGGSLDAEQARAAGLVNRVVPHAGFMGSVAEYAGTFEGHSPTIIKLGKQAFYALPGMEYAQALSHLRAMKTVVGTTADSTEGVRAFVEKRTPRWTGR